MSAAAAGWLAAVLVLAVATPADAATDTLKIYLLAGQSNMEGQGYAYTQGTDLFINNGYPDITAIQYLLENPGYTNGLDLNVYPSLADLDASYLQPRNDVWAVHRNSTNGAALRVTHSPDANINTNDPWPVGIQPLQPGFGLQSTINGIELSLFGPELSLGHYLGERMDSPVFLFKSDKGGTTLVGDWRPPSSGGTTGVHYTNTINQFKSFLGELDADLADDGKLNAYNDAAGYELAGFVWLQGWNDHVGGTSTDEYRDRLIDLVHDVREEVGVDDLPAVIIESSDGSNPNTLLNPARLQAIDALNAEHPGSAVYVGTNDVFNGYRAGFHFEVRAENFLEIGHRAGEAIVAGGYTGSEAVAVPEPASGALMLLGGAGVTLLAWRQCLARRRRLS